MMSDEETEKELAARWRETGGRPPDRAERKEMADALAAGKISRRKLLSELPLHPRLRRCGRTDG